MTSGCELHLETERRLCDVVRLSLVLRVEQILIQESRLMTRVLDRTVQHASFVSPYSVSLTSGGLFRSNNLNEFVLFQASFML